MIKGGKYLQQKRRKNIFKDKTTKNYYIIQISDPWVKKVGQNFEVRVGSGSDPTRPNPTRIFPGWVGPAHTPTIEYNHINVRPAL